MPSFHARLCLLSALLFSCAPQRGEPGGPGPGTAQDLGGTDSSSCTSGMTRCVAQQYQTCQNGTFTTHTTCTQEQSCDPGLGCVACLPSNGDFCVGNEVHSCTASGQAGPVVQDCGAGTCLGGTCQCSAAGVELIYVVDDTNDLLSFNPANGLNQFKPIGTLNCPAGDSWPAWTQANNGDPTAVPFSMSVDRNATAWVLYTSGQIFNVDTSTAACTPTTFAPGQAGFQLFGMGFSSDAMGSSAEHLFIAGGPASSPGLGNLGSVDPNTLALTTIGALPVNGDGSNGPELTGTANGDLYAYFPGKQSYVAQFDKTTGQLTRQWALQGLSGTVIAWAFAQWGGNFYIFVTTEDDFGDTDSMVHLFDPATGSDTVILDNLPYDIVGAGVSTCAPATLG